MAGPIISARQDFNGDSRDNRIYYDSWWYNTTEGTIAKWSIFFGLLFFFFAFIVLGRWHAMKRINKGLKPLGYHRWLLNRRQKALYDPSYREPQVYYTTHPPAQYNMYSMPPPVYDPSSAPPPGYQPAPGAPGGHKIDPEQGRPMMAGEGSGLDAPAPVRTHDTGASNNPYRL